MLGNSQNFGQHSFLPPHISSLFILSPQPLRPTTEILRLLCSSVVANSKICRGRSRNSSVVKSQGYFVLEQPFLQFHVKMAPYSFLWESGLLATFMLNDAHQAATKDEKWLWTYKKIPPYLSLHCNSTKQNDNVTMTIPINSGLQCFRTAALSMVTLNMESRNPMGHVYAENCSKT